MLIPETPAVAPVVSEPTSSSFVDLLGPAFRQENDVANLMEWVTKPFYEPDPTFDFAARAKQSDIFQLHPDSFIQAQSLDEFNAIERRVARETADRNALASNGVSGIAAGMLAGILSPTILLPGGAAVRGAGALKTAASVAAWTVVGVGLQEAVLQSNQETRTAGESALAIAGAAVIGGIIGGGIGYLSRGEIDKIAGDMVGLTNEPAILHPHPSPVPDEASDTLLGSTVGAKQVAPPSLLGPDAGSLAPSFKVGEALAHQSPVGRNFLVESPTARQVQANISSGGMALAGNKFGIASAELGAIEDLIGQHKAKFAFALMDFNKAFKLREVRAQSQKMFSEEVSRVLETGLQHTDPAVNASAASFRNKLFLPILQAAREVGIPGFSDISPEYAMKYLNHVTRKKFSTVNSNDLKLILKENSLEKLSQSFKKQFDSVNLTAQKEQAKADVLSLNQPDVIEARKQFQKDMAQLPLQFPGEVGNIAQEIRTLRATARASGLTKEAKKELTDRANALAITHEKALVPFGKAEAKLNERRRLLDNTYSALSDKKEKILNAIDDLERMQLDSLETVAKAGQRLLNKIDKLETDVPVATDRFIARIERSLTLLEKAEERQAKLDPADAGAMEAEVAARRVTFAEHIAAMDAAPSRAELKTALEDTLLDIEKRVKGLNDSRTLRIEKLQKDAAEINPGEAIARAKELRNRAANRLTEFATAASEKGGVKVGDTFDFTKLAEQYAEITYGHLTGLDHRAPGYSLLMERGPELARTLEIDPERVWSNGRKYSEFLERDITKLAGRYVKTMGADIELYRKFGTLNPLGADAKSNKKILVMEQVHKEFSALKKAADALPPKKREARLLALDKQERGFLRDTQVEIDRLRHVRGIPDDPGGFFFRAGRVISSLNTARLLGRMALASVPDLARPIMKAGLLDTFRYGFLPLISDFKNLKMLKTELQYAGLCLDGVLHSRAAAMLDVFTEIESGTKAERALQHVSNRMGYITGMDHWNTAMQQFAGAVLNGKMMRSLESVVLGKGSKRELQKATLFLAENNIDATSAQMIWKQLQLPGGSTRMNNGALLPNAESWALDAQGLEARRLYRAAIYKAVNDTIIIPGVERPNWVDASTTAKLIAQFRSFTLSSTTKMLVAGAQDLRSGDMAPAIGTIFSLALGAFSYYTWATLRGGKDEATMQNASPALWADEAIRRSGLLAVFGELARIGDQVPGIQDKINFNQSARRSSFGREPFTDALGPTIGLLGAIDNIAQQYANNPDSARHSLRTLMPLQNHVVISLAYDAVEKYFKGK